MSVGDFAETCADKFPLMSMGSQAEGLACADPGVRNPIGVSNFFYLMSKKNKQGCSNKLWHITWHRKWYKFWHNIYDIILKWHKIRHYIWHCIKSGITICHDIRARTYNYLNLKPELWTPPSSPWCCLTCPWSPLLHRLCLTAWLMWWTWRPEDEKDNEVKTERGREGETKKIFEVTNGECLQ